ncbi:MAG TPA: hypothetical protein VNZ26_23950, partial [Vicinamibacterales bacterium]|nr:hypothetical protein [Vicinamibacterales bacterium]
ETSPLSVTEGGEGRSKAVPLRFSVPLDSVDPGQYVVQVTVLEPGSQKVAFWRAPLMLVP